MFYSILMAPTSWLRPRELISIGEHQGYSAWGTERNLSQQITAVMPKASGIVLERAGEKWKIDPTVEKQVKDFAAAVGLLYRQDGVGWHRPYFKHGATQKEANGVRINVGRNLSKEETGAIVSNLEKILPSYEDGGEKGLVYCAGRKRITCHLLGTRGRKKRL